MKKKTLAVILIMFILIIAAVLFIRNNVLFIPSSIGETKEFSKDGLCITLTDEFVEMESQVGFDAYYVTDYCGVMVLKEPFSLEEGLAERPLSEYIQNVIANNGHTDIEPQQVDDLWFYVNDTDGLRYYSYCYKGSDAFWVVQFGCYRKDAAALEDLFYLFASTVNVD
ncbi:MAG: hypothetical protein IJA67_15560 [Oscillospiraceae bacterium]|nr:hypothetical protein [Oscillospiraceae bacterium]